jgi:hypothetical protein
MSVFGEEILELVHAVLGQALCTIFAAVADIKQLALAGIVRVGASSINSRFSPIIPATSLRV